MDALIKCLVVACIPWLVDNWYFCELASVHLKKLCIVCEPVNALVSSSALTIHHIGKLLFMW
jgi:hypothetical protein